VHVRGVRIFARQSERLVPVLQALLKHVSSRQQDSKASGRIEQIEEGHARLELAIVARESGRKLAQECAKDFLPLLSQVIDMPIRATRLPLNFMEYGSHLLITPQRWIEMIAVESLTQNPLDLALEFIAMVGTGTEFG